MKLLSAITALAFVLAIALSGGAGFGRVLLAAGLPSLAVPFLEDPAWKGVALYRAERFAEAAEAFTQSGAAFNLGNAQVRAEAYAAALEAYDKAIEGGDGKARTNFDLVTAYYTGLKVDPDGLIFANERKDGPKVESFIARGDARATGTGSEVTNTATVPGLLELESRSSVRRVRRIFDDTFMAADVRWLEQLSDVPGEYLKARIQAEHKRRVKLGVTALGGDR